MCARAAGTAAFLTLLPGLVAPADARQAPSTLYVVFNDISPCGSMPFPGCPVTRVMRATVAPDHGRIDWVRDVPKLFDIKEAYVTPDGGTLVYLGISLATGPGVYLHDVATGGTTTVAPFHGAKILLGNPVRPEVYLFDGTGATALSPSGIRRIDLPCPPNDRAGISADGRRASVTASCGPVPLSTAGTIVFDSMTGAVVSNQPLYGKVSAGGDVLVTREFANGVFLLQRRDVVSGHLLTAVANPGFEMVVDAGSGDVLTYDRGSHSVHVMDGVSLAVKWSTPFGTAIAANGPEPVIDPANGMLFAALDGGGVYIADTRGRRLLGYAYFAASTWARLAVGPPPPAAPGLMPAVVQGQAVHLSWRAGGAPAALTRYLLDVGSAPGLSDIFSGLDVGLQTSFGASGVPPGTYYVRVRAGNYSGLGAPSNEVVVQVP